MFGCYLLLWLRAHVCDQLVPACSVLHSLYCGLTSTHLHYFEEQSQRTVCSNVP